MRRTHLPVWLTSLALALAPSAASAQSWSSFAEAFPAFPCQDGWMACSVGQGHLDPDLQRDAEGMPQRADLRVDWFDLRASSSFSPFVDLPGTAAAVPSATSTVAAPRPVASKAPSPAPVRPTTKPAAVVLAAPEPVIEPVAQGTSEPPPDEPRGTPEAVVVPEPERTVVEPEPAVVPPEPQGLPDDCSDMGALETTALLGRLTSEQLGCLEGRLGSADKMTDRKKISLLEQANAWHAGDKTAWEGLAKRHLEQIDQSDPDLCYRYAIHLSSAGTGRAAEVVRWSEVALENRSVWTGSTYTTRVNGLYKARTAASQQLWRAAEERVASGDTTARARAEDHRLQTKTYAREWLDYARSAGLDTATALQVCVQAAGTAAWCE
ncbi:MAG: hypothetical protein H6738_04000 [Alphaproteobacteria bacterium]|nr:hypothetical protein [Alphaproteobacteria bacterium]MCB9695933.1 hypothetical protein [Alphaproteobacteria bacterium]